MLDPIQDCSPGKTAVAIGKFDALHLGHQALLRHLVAIARSSHCTATVVTFSNHPNSVLHPESVPVPVIGANQKKRLLAEMGIEEVISINFDLEFASLSPKEFVVKYLLPLNVKEVVVGREFRFGFRGSGDANQLRALGSNWGFRVNEIDNLGEEGEKYSTSKVRQLLESGQVAEAALILGRWHRTEGTVEHGRKLGRKLGYPTANLSRDAEGMLPADGVYAGYLISDGVRYPAAHSIGTNDSIEAVPRLLESHVIGRDDLDLYDKTVVCEYVAQVRGWAKFDSVEALTDQIASDVKRAAELLED
ncbi:MAG: riboflavin biosynthesis protein RibF [Actinomycetota bacterium]|jgi:riboflavin kinase/FMN adenylyltransferase